MFTHHSPTREPSVSLSATHLICHRAGEEAVQEFDEWYPGSKFVLSTRRSLRALVNSDLRNVRRNKNLRPLAELRKEAVCNETTQLTNLTGDETDGLHNRASIARKEIYAAVRSIILSARRCARGVNDSEHAHGIVYVLMYSITNMHVLA